LAAAAAVEQEIDNCRLNHLLVLEEMNWRELSHQQMG
jgi:hypothetical protein